jgi:hypothetical protein
VLLLARLLFVGLGRLLRLRLLQLLLIRWSEPQQFPGQLMVQLLTPLCSSNSSRGYAALEVLQSTTRSRGGPVGRADVGDGRTAAEAANALTAASMQQQQQEDEVLLPVYYHLYSDARGYADVARSFLAQQAAGSSSRSPSWGTSVAGLFRAVVHGELWGIGLGCKS